MNKRIIQKINTLDQQRDRKKPFNQYILILFIFISIISISTTPKTVSASPLDTKDILQTVFLFLPFPTVMRHQRVNSHWQTVAVYLFQKSLFTSTHWLHFANSEQLFENYINQQFYIMYTALSIAGPYILADYFTNFDKTIFSESRRGVVANRKLQTIEDIRLWQDKYNIWLNGMEILRKIYINQFSFLLNLTNKQFLQNIFLQDLFRYFNKVENIFEPFYGGEAMHEGKIVEIFENIKLFEESFDRDLSHFKKMSYVVDDHIFFSFGTKKIFSPLRENILGGFHRRQLYVFFYYYDSYFHMYLMHHDNTVLEYLYSSSIVSLIQKSVLSNFQHLGNDHILEMERIFPCTTSTFKTLDQLNSYNEAIFFDLEPC